MLAAAAAACLLAASAPAAQRAGVVTAAAGGGGEASFIGVQASAGLLYGEAHEHVYDFNGRQMSRLDWDLDQIVMGGLNGSVRLFNGLTLNAGFWMPLTEGKGQMEDWDWENERSSHATHYSLSDVDVAEGYQFDINLAWDIFTADSLVVRLLGGYKQDGWTWEDRGVYLLYPELNYIPYPLNGEHMIRYEQEFHMPYLGVEMAAAWGGLSVSAYAAYSPYVTAKDWDHHILRDLYFEETFDGGDMFAIGGEVRYTFARSWLPGLFLSASVDYQCVDLIVGDLYVEDRSTGETGWMPDGAGIENEYIVVSFGIGGHF